MTATLHEQSSTEEVYNCQTQKILQATRKNIFNKIKAKPPVTYWNKECKIEKKIQKNDNINKTHAIKY